MDLATTVKTVTKLVLSTASQVGAPVGFRDGTDVGELEALGATLGYYSIKYSLSYDCKLSAAATLFRILIVVHSNILHTTWSLCPNFQSQVHEKAVQER